MARSYNVAILGATGLVGQVMAKVLAERNFPIRNLRLLASARSEGTTIDWQGTSIAVEEARDSSFDGIDVALFSAGTEISRHFAPIAARAGAVVIDNSSAWRMDETVPLVVPEVNPDDALTHNGIIANPNCSTIQMVVALNPLHQVNPIRRVVVDTYQSVSGTGKEAVEELRDQSRQRVAGDDDVQPSVYPHPIAFNLFPHIDTFQEDGSCKEEWKMVHETRKIMHLPELKMIATTVRVPVYWAHSEAVHVDFTAPMPVARAREILETAPGVVVQDDLTKNLYPTPLAAAGHDSVFVGRLRPNDVFDNGLSLWVVADNIRKGAASNAVQIAELLVARGAL
ncbi:MAG TPA: aspartate-semialdehyde dehydrogenase [Chloroflexota bacterium]|nr:aspartate-semialdehyde dehydrogenase [Chloroflexota bacterium]